MKIWLRKFFTQAAYLGIGALLVCVFWGRPSAVRAQGTAGQAGEFLRYGVGARALGMGRAYTAVADNANAVYWNPAGLFDVIKDGISFSLMYARLFESTRYNFAAVAVPLELLVPSESGTFAGSELRHWNLGFGYLLVGSDGYEVRTEDNQTTGQTFSDQQTAFFFSLTRSFAIGEEQFGFGASVKLLTHDLFGSRSKAMAVDLGIKYQPHWNWITLGIVAQNVNEPDFGFGPRPDVIPRSVRGGMALHPHTGHRQLDAITVSADLFVLPPGKRDREWFLGGEYDFLRAFGLPVRVRFGFNTTKRLSFGFNLDLPNNTIVGTGNQMLPRLDWAYQADDGNSLGALSQQFSMDFSYTPFTSQRWYERGMEKFNDGRFDLAREDFRRASVAKNPNHSLYPYYALLRLGDIELKTNRDKKAGLRAAMQDYDQAFPQLLKKKQAFSKTNQNLESLLYYVQGLIDRGKLKESLRVLETGADWYSDMPQKDSFTFLEGWANLKLGNIDGAEQLLKTASECSSCRFLLGLIALHRGEFESAYAIFDTLIQKGGATIAENLLILPFSDHLLLDDSFFLRTYAGVEVGGSIGANPEHVTASLADIQRYFPFSDVLDLMKESGVYDRFIDEGNPPQKADLESFFGKYWQYIGFQSGV